MTTASTRVALAIAASDRTPSLALRTAGAGADDVQRVELPRSRGDYVIESIRELCARVGVEPMAIGALFVDVGPGSYTGLRVAVTFARFLQSFGALESVYVATSFELMTLAALDAGLVTAGDGHVRPILDARRERFHTARLTIGNTVTLTEEPAALGRDELLARHDADDAILVDDRARGLLGDALSGRRVASAPTPDAVTLLDPRLAARPASFADLEPLYLMGSYAEG